MHRLRNIAGFFGTIMKWYGALFVVPMLFAIGYGNALMPFVVPLVLSTGLGALLEWRFPDSELERADGFLLVILTWIAVSLFGALPYYWTGNGAFASPINAIFESVSGFTCTGSTVLNEISLDAHSHAIMLWRQLTQWIGGMGILVLAVAVLPRLSVGGAQFLDNEVPGPRMDRLTPHMAATARRLWILYVGASVLLFIIFLGLHYTGWAPEMDPFQSIAHALTTMPSGGFSPQGRSVEAFGAPAQWVIIVFMLVAAMNFTLLWRALLTGPKALFENTEFKTYIGIYLLGGVVVSLMLLSQGQFETIEQNFRHGLFQMGTFLTTTGYASTDFAIWSEDTLLILVAMMFISGCVGSTSGGLKVMRWIVGVKVIYREVLQRIHPSSVLPLRLNGRVLNQDVVRGATVLIVIYVGLFAVSTVLVTLDTHIAGEEMQIIEVVTAVTAALGNIGPGLGQVGPMENFTFFPVFSKFWLCLLMIAGRLEIMTCLVLFAPTYWND